MQKKTTTTKERSATVFLKPQKEMVVKKHFTNKGDSDPSYESS